MLQVLQVHLDQVVLQEQLELMVKVLVQVLQVLQVQ
jgi:hypothetical protein